MTENEISEQIVDVSFRIHTILGPGLLESVYETVMAHELTGRGLRVERQCIMPVVYGGVTIDEGYRLDLMVNDKVIVELKSVEHLNPVHKKQLLTYLKLSGKKLGLLINFGEMYLKDGITRIANGL